MGLKFNRVSDFKRGTLVGLLSEAYSFDKKYENANIGRWSDDDKFFFDNPQIADMCGFITTLSDEPIGFAFWDPRNMPEYAIIGDNCIIPKHKGKGYGKLQLQEAINRITRNNVKRIFVSTDNGLIPAQRMYESAGFVKLDTSSLETWQISQNADIYYGMDIRVV